MDECSLPLDVTLVSGARPDLLARTLASFHDRMLRHFDVAQVFCNIDPVFGGRDAVEDCARILRHHFPQAVIFMPERPGFGRAVKRLWLATGDRHVLHLEDDWDLLAEVRPRDVFPLFAPDVGMVPLASTDATDPEDLFFYRTKRTRFLGITFATERVNSWGTTPRFFGAGLARQFGELLKPGMDPERQVHRNRNKRLSRAHEPWKARALRTAVGKAVVADTGMEWKRHHGVRKLEWRGYVFWQQA